MCRIVVQKLNMNILISVHDSIDINGFNRLWNLRVWSYQASLLTNKIQNALHIVGPPIRLFDPHCSRYDYLTPVTTNTKYSFDPPGKYLSPLWVSEIFIKFGALGWSIVCIWYCILEKIVLILVFILIKFRESILLLDTLVYGMHLIFCSSRLVEVIII